MERADPIKVATAIQARRYPGSEVAFLAGSVMRGEGPPIWGDLEIRSSRYAITDVDDLMEPRSRAEQVASATVLYGLIANYYLRSRQLRSAKGKAIPRRVWQVDARFAKRFDQAFAQVFETGDATSVFELVTEVLSPHGGRLLDGHRLAAPADC